VQGPSVQIGAGLGSSIAKFFKLSVEDRRLAIIAGIAGTLSAIFRSPIGAALFSVEVLYRRDIETEALVPAIIASMISYITSSYIVGYRGFFPKIYVDIKNIFAPDSMVMFLLLSLISAALAQFYIYVFTAIRRYFRILEIKKLSKHRWIKPVIGASIVGLIGVFIPIALGGGAIYAAKIIEASINGEDVETDILGLGLLSSLIILIVFKIFTTAFSVGSGGSGGLFAPSLFIGAILGYLYGLGIASKFSPLPPYVYAYIGMASFFGAATKTPIASSFMIAEMSGSYPLLIPALITSLIANEIVKNKSLYEAQIVRRVKPELTSLPMLLEVVKKQNELPMLKVRDVVNEEYATAYIDDRVSYVINVMAKTKQKIIPVIDREGFVRGAIDSTSLRKALESSIDMPLSFLELANPPLLSLDQPLTLAIEEMIRRGFDYAIVIDEEGKYVGVLLAEDIAITLAHYAAKRIGSEQYEEME
ncbi:MAG TPA: chloride channel protein, partial [Ignisphaera sp.]|nr:chloride channel protein [Ignisphaera sp.]